MNEPDPQAAKEAARADPLFRPISIARAMARTGRSRRTISRWITDGRLRTVDLDGVRALIEREVIDVERETRHAQGGARKALADRRRRVDADGVEDASTN